MSTLLRKLESFIFMLALIGLGFVIYVKEYSAVGVLENKHDLKMIAFDVGQGDAIFLESRDGTQMLVDGGPDDSILEKLGANMSPQDRFIDYIVLTHPHADHLAGFVQVLRYYDVGSVVMTDSTNKTNIYESFLGEIKNKKINVLEPEALGGMRFGEAVIDMLFPSDEVPELADSENLNENSIIFKISIGDKDILLTGDAEKNEEDALIQNNMNLEAEILKAGHHGSKTSTSADFLEKVDPEFAIVSVGENSYGHPHLSVLNRLENFGSKVFRTDLDGDVFIFINDGQIAITKRK